ncbi:Uncharacterised protein [Salmonella enterica subsp. enterica serovar Typhi]|nr:Uncharacterised protein [Salmonella enterica subsp. enterica serovar Typhi]CHD91978.1 Uncharacterised protein [Salmonella enterica subsp. enterica serovar Typhi]CHI38638.1 Uncharacterised protein [Salmonella enterica subsp. enterica serovar Typhi]CRB19955.1 Uncharacterised protein [Salmonella enterica subsp. enterica serovar Typhi]
MLFAGIANRPDDVIGIFVQAIVHRTVGLRAGTFIIHAQTAAHVEALDINAQLMQLNIETRGLAHAGRDIANVRHLRSQVEVQQLQTVQTPSVTQGLHQLQHLRRRQAEF